MTETMLDKAALAICNQIRSARGFAPIRTLDVVETPDVFRNQARAVLQAIREPDEETVVALVTAPVDFGDHSGGNLVSSWRAAIDSILSQSQEGK